jgi:FkbM family methyltransferase
MRQRFTRDVAIVDGSNTYKFCCENVYEFRRCMKFYTKEPGTVEWIKKSVKPGDIFYDVGANIGIYTILAAHCTGISGKVYAFEPHSANFTRLLDNISANSFQGIIVPCSFALNDRQGFFDFKYSSRDASSADNQLVSSPEQMNVASDAITKELKAATSIDMLLDIGKCLPPDHVKIDVDGIEISILKGMQSLLNGKNRPMSVQVEVGQLHKDEILNFMQDNNYILSEKHYTAAGLRKINQGQDPVTQVFNAIFNPTN